MANTIGSGYSQFTHLLPCHHLSIKSETFNAHFPSPCSYKWSEDMVRASETKAEICSAWKRGSGVAFAFFTKGGVLGTAPLLPVMVDGVQQPPSSHEAANQNALETRRSERQVAFDGVIWLLAARDCLLQTSCCVRKITPMCFS